ncbi:MAG: glycosyltransferase family 2 protein [Deltaproteobacteria bacterium]|nr:glycosyltransferase family 2 protein [Deltaproteobacteria bacterium]
MNIHLSIVSPVYRAEACIEELYQRLTTVLQNLPGPYEIIFVDDGSPDQSWARIKRLATQDAHVVALQLSRNFGQHHAIAAGLSASRGHYTVVMDCDLQHPPEVIPQLLAQAKAGADIVYTRHTIRMDSTFKQRTSRAFFFLVNLLSPLSVTPGQGSFSLLSRQVVDEYLRVADVHSHYLFVLHWLGFRSTCVDVEHSTRFAGASSYSLIALISHALNGITSHSTRLLHISTGVGLLFASFAIVQILYLIYRKWMHAIGVDGWASLMVVTWFVGGAILFSLGVMGLYLGRMFELTRHRPLFIVREQINGGQ